MTPSHAVKNGTRYRYYVSCSMITEDRTDNAAALRIPAAEIEQLVSDRVHRWLLDPGSIDKSAAARLDRVPGRGVRAVLLALSGGFSRDCQAATAGSLKIGSSLNGAIVSSVM